MGSTSKLGLPSADQLADVGQDQEQGCGEYDKTGLACFRMFEHDEVPFIVMPAWRRLSAKGLGQASAPSH